MLMVTFFPVFPCEAKSLIFFCHSERSEESLIPHYELHIEILRHFVTQNDVKKKKEHTLSDMLLNFGLII